MPAQRPMGMMNGGISPVSAPVAAPAPTLEPGDPPTRNTRND